MGIYMPIEGTFNFRDIGGEAAADGRRVKTGCLFRSDALHQLSERGMEQLRNLKIRTVVDFRGPLEAAKAPNRLPAGIETVALPPNAELASAASAAHSDDEMKIQKMAAMAATAAGRAFFQENLDAMAGQMRQFAIEESSVRCYGAFLRLLLTDSKLPLIFHCRGGKDRTGWAAALILSLLGCPREAVIADYLKTAEYNRERNQNRMAEYHQYTHDPLLLNYLSSLMQVKGQYLLAALAEVDKTGGIEPYAETVLGLAQSEIRDLRERLLE